MKFYLILAVTFILFSCGKDDEPDLILNQSNCQILSYGTSNFTYDNEGNLIKSESLLEGFEKYIRTFDYSTVDQNVIKVQTLRPEFEPQDRNTTNLEYLFDDGKIFKIIDTKNYYERRYYYNPDGTLRKVELNKDSVVHVYNSKKTNIVQSTTYFHTFKPMVTDYTFDDKENLLKGHLASLFFWAGHPALHHIGENEYFNKNNVLKSVSSNTQNYTSSYTYDANGLPSSFARSPMHGGTFEESGTITYSCD